MTARLGPVSITDVVRYAGASGDLNPLHHDDAFARSAGHDGVISMGMLHGGWLVSHAAGSGEAARRSGSTTFRLRYHGTVRLGADLVADVDPDSAERFHLLQDGDLKAVLEVSSAAPSSPTENVDRLQTGRLLVELGAARAFARAVHWPFDVEFGSDVPPTFVSVVSTWLDSDPIDRVGLDRSRTLLGETKVELVGGPIRVGDELDVREYVTPERTRNGSGGQIRLIDLVAELSDDDGLRAVYTNTFVLLPEPPLEPMTGSLDTHTGEVFFPSREVSVDGTLRPLDTVTLAETGTLYAWTTFLGVDYGQVDLTDGVRVQVRLHPGDHVIGATYRLTSAPPGTPRNQNRWFTRA